MRHAELGGLRFELHVLDDASDRNARKKDAMAQDLVERGLVHNYTRLPRPAGTVKVLSPRHLVLTGVSNIC